jgi:ribosome-associated toxin RatA of RatAB toxin-antitoxin module
VHTLVAHTLVAHTQIACTRVEHSTRADLREAARAGTAPKHRQPPRVALTMQRVNRSVLVPWPAARMFELVDQVEAYPQFLPWCAGVQVLDRDDDRKTVRIDIDYHGVRAHFTTDNVNSPPRAIVVTLKDGPFRHLHGEWRFRALSETGCRIEFELAYEFSTYLLERAVGPVFSHIANTFIDAFVRRADQLAAGTASESR